jgi:hypothetical protein
MIWDYMGLYRIIKLATLIAGWFISWKIPNKHRGDVNPHTAPRLEPIQRPCLGVGRVASPDENRQEF